MILGWIELNDVKDYGDYSIKEMFDLVNKSYDVGEIGLE